MANVLGLRLHQDKPVPPTDKGDGALRLQVFDREIVLPFDPDRLFQHVFCLHLSQREPYVNVEVPADRMPLLPGGALFGLDLRADAIVIVEVRQELRGAADRERQREPKNAHAQTPRPPSRLRCQEGALSLLRL